MSEIKIIKTNLHDEKQARDIIHLLSHYARDIMEGGEDLPAEVKDKLIPELTKRPSAFIVLAYAAAKAVGLAMCFEGFSTFLQNP